MPPKMKKERIDRERRYEINRRTDIDRPKPEAGSQEIHDLFMKSARKDAGEEAQFDYQPAFNSQAEEDAFLESFERQIKQWLQQYYTNEHPDPENPKRLVKRPFAYYMGPDGENFSFTNALRAIIRRQLHQPGVHQMGKDEKDMFQDAILGDKDKKQPGLFFPLPGSHEDINEGFVGKIWKYSPRPASLTDEQFKQMQEDAAKEEENVRNLPQLRKQLQQLKSQNAPAEEIEALEKKIKESEPGRWKKLKYRSLPVFFYQIAPRAVRSIGTKYGEEKRKLGKVQNEGVSKEGDEETTALGQQRSKILAPDEEALQRESHEAFVDKHGHQKGAIREHLGKLINPNIDPEIKAAAEALARAKGDAARRGVNVEADQAVKNAKVALEKAKANAPLKGAVSETEAKHLQQVFDAMVGIHGEREQKYISREQSKAATEARENWKAEKEKKLPKYQTAVSEAENDLADAEYDAQERGLSGDEIRKDPKVKRALSRLRDAQYALDAFVSSKPPSGVSEPDFKSVAHRDVQYPWGHTTTIDPETGKPHVFAPGEPRTPEKEPRTLTELMEHDTSAQTWRRNYHTKQQSLRKKYREKVKAISHLPPKEQVEIPHWKEELQEWMETQQKDLTSKPVSWHQREVKKINDQADKLFERSEEVQQKINHLPQVSKALRRRDPGYAEKMDRERKQLESQKNEIQEEMEALKEMKRFHIEILQKTKDKAHDLKNDFNRQQWTPQGKAWVERQGKAIEKIRSRHPDTPPEKSVERDQWFQRQIQIIGMELERGDVDRDKLLGECMAALDHLPDVNELRDQAAQYRESIGELRASAEMAQQDGDDEEYDRATFELKENTQKFNALRDRYQKFQGYKSQLEAFMKQLDPSETPDLRGAKERLEQRPRSIDAPSREGLTHERKEEHGPGREEAPWETIQQQWQEHLPALPKEQVWQNPKEEAIIKRWNFLSAGPDDIAKYWFDLQRQRKQVYEQKIREWREIIDAKRKELHDKHLGHPDWEEEFHEWERKFLSDNPPPDEPPDIVPLPPNWFKKKGTNLELTSDGRKKLTEYIEKIRNKTKEIIEMSAPEPAEGWKPRGQRRQTQKEQYEKGEENAYRKHIEQIRDQNAKRKQELKEHDLGELVSEDTDTGRPEDRELTPEQEEAQFREKWRKENPLDKWGLGSTTPERPMTHEQKVDKALRQAYGRMMWAQWRRHVYNRGKRRLKQRNEGKPITSPQPDQFIEFSERYEQRYPFDNWSKSDPVAKRIRQEMGDATAPKKEQEKQYNPDTPFFTEMSPDRQEEVIQRDYNSMINEEWERYQEKTYKGPPKDEQERSERDNAKKEFLAKAQERHNYQDFKKHYHEQHAIKAPTVSINETVEQGFHKNQPRPGEKDDKPATPEDRQKAWEKAEKRAWELYSKSLYGPHGRPPSGAMTREEFRKHYRSENPPPQDLQFPSTGFGKVDGEPVKVLEKRLIPYKDPEEGEDAQARKMQMFRVRNVKDGRERWVPVDKLEADEDFEEDFTHRAKPGTPQTLEEGISRGIDQAREETKSPNLKYKGKPWDTKYGHPQEWDAARAVLRQMHGEVAQEEDSKKTLLGIWEPGKNKAKSPFTGKPYTAIQVKVIRRPPKSIEYKGRVKGLKVQGENKGRYKVVPLPHDDETKAVTVDAKDCDPETKVLLSAGKPVEYPAGPKKGQPIKAGDRIPQSIEHHYHIVRAHGGKGGLFLDQKQDYLTITGTGKDSDAKAPRDFPGATPDQHRFLTSWGEKGSPMYGVLLPYPGAKEGYLVRKDKWLGRGTKVRVRFMASQQRDGQATLFTSPLAVQGLNDVKGVKVKPWAEKELPPEIRQNLNKQPWYFLPNEESFKGQGDLSTRTMVRFKGPVRGRGYMDFVGQVVQQNKREGYIILHPLQTNEEGRQFINTTQYLYTDMEHWEGYPNSPHVRPASPEEIGNAVIHQRPRGKKPAQEGPAPKPPVQRSREDTQRLVDQTKARIEQRKKQKESTPVESDVSDLATSLSRKNSPPSLSSLVKEQGDS